MRRLVRRRPTRRRRKAKLLPPVESLHKIGTKEYIESVVVSVYSWQHLPPGSKYNQELPNKKFRSLKSACALAVAQNIDAVDSSLVDSVPWTCWKLVWYNVLKLQNDSFLVLRIFAPFLRLSSFRCHDTTQIFSRLAKLRSQAIASSTIPGSRNHRFENIFANVDLNNVSSYLCKLKFRPWVFVDLSLVSRQLSIEQHYALLNFPELVALDLSNSRVVDDSFLYRLASLHRSKLKQLTIVKLTNCPNVTQKGIRYLFDVSKQNRLDSSLSLIQCDHYIVSSFSLGELTCIPGTRWSLADDNASKSIAKFPLGLKLHALYHNFADKVVAKAIKTETDSQALSLLSMDSPIAPGYIFKSKDRMFLDIMFHSDTFESSDYGTSLGVSKLEGAWNARLQSRNRSSLSLYCYIADHNHVIQEEEELIKSPSPEMPVPIFKASVKRKPDVPAKPRKRPKQMKTNYKDFFDL